MGGDERIDNVLMAVMRGKQQHERSRHILSSMGRMAKNSRKQ
jgi:hypothetical protein